MTLGYLSEFIVLLHLSLHSSNSSLMSEISFFIVSVTSVSVSFVFAKLDFSMLTSVSNRVMFSFISIISVVSVGLLSSLAQVLFIRDGCVDCCALNSSLTSTEFPLIIINNNNNKNNNNNNNDLCD